MSLSPLQLARFLAVRKRPYFAPVIYALKYVETPGLGTVGVDNFGRLYYDPEKLVEWGPDHSAAALIHEVGHVLRRHGKRCPGTEDWERALWNLAADCSVNDEYESTPDVKLPPHAIYPKTFSLPNDQLEEFYYRELLKKQEKQSGKGKGKAQGGGGKQKGDGEGQEGETSGKGGFGGKGCGSGADGGHHEHELPGTSEAKDGKGETVGTMSEVELDVTRRAVAEKIREHVASRGTVPGDWAQWADATLAPPKIDWRKHLQRVMRGTLGVIAGKVDYSYSRTSRRQSACPDVVLPGFVRPLVRVAFIADVSGSMPDEWINDTFNEARGCAIAAGAALRLVQVDAAVQMDEILQPGDRRKLKMVGRGGTDLTVGFDRLFENRVKRPDMLVIATDGYTPWPSAPPAGCRVIGVFFTDDGMKQAPDWIVKVRYEPNDKHGS